MSSVAPGWYNDADDPALIRWWDGDAWTVHTQPLPVAAPASEATAAPASEATAASPPFDEPTTPDLDVPPAAGAEPGHRDVRVSESPSLPVSEPVRLVPPTSPVTESAPSGWQNSESPAPSWASHESAAWASTPWSSPATFAQPAEPVNLEIADYEPMVRTWGSVSGGSTDRPVTGVTTAGSWMLALSPVLLLGLLALGWLLTEGATASATPIVGTSLGFVLLAWVIIATIADFRRLGSLGHEYRPSVLWIVLGPLMYLIVRAIHVVRTTGRGAAPTWVYVVLSIVVGAALGATSLVLPREASLTELRAVEATIVADLQQQGFDYSVICPDEATLAVGSTFVCTAYDEVGPAMLLRVSHDGVPGLFSYDVESSSSGS